jgi:hypothetical protein
MAKRFAVLEENNVINVIMAESKEIAQELFDRPCFEIEENSIAGTGWIFDPVNQKLLMPEPEVTE